MKRCAAAGHGRPARRFRHLRLGPRPRARRAPATRRTHHRTGAPLDPLGARCRSRAPHSRWDDWARSELLTRHLGFSHWDIMVSPSQRRAGPMSGTRRGHAHESARGPDPRDAGGEGPEGHPSGPLRRLLQPARPGRTTTSGGDSTAWNGSPSSSPPHPELRSAGLDRQRTATPSGGSSSTSTPGSTSSRPGQPGPRQHRRADPHSSCPRRPGDGSDQLLDELTSDSAPTLRAGFGIGPRHRRRDIGDVERLCSSPSEATACSDNVAVQGTRHWPSAGRPDVGPHGSTAYPTA
jgi:hypothetical protein